MSIAKQQELRLEFPYFQENPGWIFFENAGGSQVPSSVIDSISKYYSRIYVQVGAGYEQSNEAIQTVKLAHDFSREMMNGTGIGEVVLGPSTTQLVHILARAFDKLITSTDDEIIVSNLAHESNYGAWTKLRGKVIEWKAHEGVNLDELSDLLSERTRIVAIPHASNIIGEILDVQAIVKLVRQKSPRARIIVDGVAYAPHRAIDVREWNVDFYVFSYYKVSTIYILDNNSIFLIGFWSSSGCFIWFQCSLARAC
jgi:selenocysteine lyase/cysteine desulfurase